MLSVSQDVDTFHLTTIAVCVGVGDPITLKQTRMLLALRINVLAKGYRYVL